MSLEATGGPQERRDWARYGRTGAIRQPALSQVSWLYCGFRAYRGRIPCERVLHRLPGPPVLERLALAHGDLHDGNVVLTGAGVGLLDLDGVVAADPAEDVGNLWARLVLRAVQLSAAGWSA